MTTSNIIYIVAGVLAFDPRRAFTNDKGEEVYSATITAEESQPDLIQLKSAIKEIGASSGFQFAGNGKPLFRQPVKNGDDTKYAHLHGKTVVKVNSKWLPKFWGTDNNELSPPQADSLLFPGQFVKLRIKLDAYNKNGQGVAGYWQGLQIIGGGTRIEGIGGNSDEQAGEDFAKHSQDSLPAYMQEAVAQAEQDSNMGFDEEPASAKGNW